MHMRNLDITTLARKIRVRRAEIGMSQMKLAEAADCHINHIGRIERGQADPSFSMLLRIARGLKISPKELMPDE